MAACSSCLHIHATLVEKLVVGCLLRARSLLLCKLQGRLRRELRGMDALHCSFDVLVLVFVDAGTWIEFNWSLACRLVAEVIEHLALRQVPGLLATAPAFRSPLLLIVLLDLVEELPQVAWVVGGEARILARPIPPFSPVNLLWEIVIKRLQKFHSVTKSRQISTIARRNFVETTRRDSPWRPATVAQVRSSTPSRNPEISTHIRAPPASRFLSKWRCLAGP